MIQSPARLISAAIQSAARCRDNETTRFCLSGAQFRFDASKSTLTVTASDGRQLATTTVAVTSTEERGDWEAVFDIAQLWKLRASKRAGLVTLQRDDDTLRVSWGNGLHGSRGREHTAVCSAIHGRFPNWEQCFKADAPASVTKICPAIWAESILGDEWEGYDVDINGKATFTRELTLSHEEHTGETIPMRVNLGMFAEHLATIFGEFADIKQWGTDDVVEVSGGFGVAKSRYLLMPMSTRR